jgi:hypothetical protein
MAMASQEKAGRYLFVTSNRCTRVKNAFRLNTVVSCACVLILLFSVCSVTIEDVMSRACYLVEIFESRTSLTICVDNVGDNCETPLGSNPLTSTSEKDTPKTRAAKLHNNRAASNFPQLYFVQSAFISIRRELLIPLTLLY